MKETNNSRKAFYELEVWNKARKLRNDAFELIIHFPSEEKYGLTDQIKRASRSITACIAEGHERFTHKDQTHFYIIARGSATELLNHFIDAFDQKYIDRQLLKSYQLIIEEIIKMLNGLISYLRKQATNSRTKV